MNPVLHDVGVTETAQSQADQHYYFGIPVDEKQQQHSGMNGDGDERYEYPQPHHHCSPLLLPL